MSFVGKTVNTVYGSFVLIEIRGAMDCECCGTVVHGSNLCDGCRSRKCNPENTYHCFLDDPRDSLICSVCTPHGGEAPCDGSCSYKGECAGYESAKAYVEHHEPHNTREALAAL